MSRVIQDLAKFMSAAPAVQPPSYAQRTLARFAEWVTSDLTDAEVRDLIKHHPLIRGIGDSKG